MKTPLKKFLLTFSTVFATTLFILGILAIAIPKLKNTQAVKANDNNSPYLNTSNWQRTASIIPWNKGELATPEFKQAVDKAKNTGFNEISLHIQLFQSSLRDNELYLAAHAPTDLELTNAITYINSIGLNTSLKFFVDVDYHKGSFWRAYIDPTDRPLWFKNYTTFVKKYAQIAEQYNVKSLSIGTELYYLAKDSTAYNTIGWNKLISDVRSIYNGKLTYGYNHAGENDNGELKFIENLDFVGISGYYPVTSNSNASVAEIEANWDEIIKTKLDPIYNKYKKPIVFTELGYRSISEAVNAPWDSNVSGVLSVSTQANLYEGLIRSLSKVSYFQGWHTWDWGVSPDLGGLNDKSFNPQNKPAEKILAKYYRYNGGEVPANWQYIKPIIINTSTSTSSSLPAVNLPQTSTSSSSSVPNNLPLTNSSSSTVETSTSTANTTQTSTVSATTVSTKPFEISLAQDKANPNKLILSIQNNQLKDYQNIILDIEIYNPDETKVDQVVKAEQKILNNTLNTYEFEYNPKIDSKYLIKFGFFDDNWKLIEWHNNLGIYNLNVKSDIVSDSITVFNDNAIAINQTKFTSTVNSTSSAKNVTSSTSTTRSTNSNISALNLNKTTQSSSKSSFQDKNNNNETMINWLQIIMGGWTTVALALKK